MPCDEAPKLPSCVFASLPSRFHTILSNIVHTIHLISSASITRKTTSDLQELQEAEFVERDAGLSTTLCQMALGH